MKDAELELAFVRQLAVHGLTIGGELSQDARRERIRIAILADNLEGKPMSYTGQGETFGAAYERCYGEALDRRLFGRDARGRPILAERRPAAEPETPQREDDEGDEDEDVEGG